MPQDKSAVNQFLAGTEEEKSPFASEETELFADKTVTTTEEGDTNGEEEPEKALPFHKDPKVQRYVEKQVEKALKKHTPTATEQFKAEVQGDDDDLTNVLTRIIGNDTPERVQAIKDFRKQLGSLEEKGAQRAMQQLEQQAEQQREQDVAAQEELDTAFEEIEDTYSVDLSSNSPTARKTRSDFVDYIRKIAPKNEDGEVIAFPDLSAAYEEFAERSKKAPTNNRAKELAARGMQRSTDASKQPAVGSTWKEVDKLFNKLG